MFVVILFTLSAQGLDCCFEFTEDRTRFKMFLNQFSVVPCHGSDCFSDSLVFSLDLLRHSVHTAQILTHMRLRLH